MAILQQHRNLASNQCKTFKPTTALCWSRRGPTRLKRKSNTSNVSLFYGRRSATFKTMAIVRGPNRRANQRCFSTASHLRQTLFLRRHRGAVRIVRTVKSNSPPPGTSVSGETRLENKNLPTQAGHSPWFSITTRKNVCDSRTFIVPRQEH